MRNLTKTEKAIVITSYILKITVIIAIIWSIFQERWIVLFLSSLTLIFSFIPAMIERNYKITLPLEFEFLILIFLYGTLFLGEIGDYYTKVWWWDIALHTLSGIIFGIIGFIFVYVMNRESKINVHLKSIYVAIFSFTFAVSIGAVWEIFEFSMDSFFGTNMQKSGLVDTMWDLIVDVVGALIVSTSGYFYVKNVKTPLFTNLIDKFFCMNKGRKKKIKFGKNYF